jgi:hypothetical protein
VGGQKRGYDPDKELKGNKRHLFLMDPQGLLLRLVLKAKVHAARVFVCDGIRWLMALLGRRFALLLPPLWL